MRWRAREAMVNFYGVNLVEHPDTEIRAHLANVQVIEERSREAFVNGGVSGSSAFYIREPRGVFLIGFYNDGNPDRKAALHFRPDAATGVGAVRGRTDARGPVRLALPARTSADAAEPAQR